MRLELEVAREELEVIDCSKMAFLVGGSSGKVGKGVVNRVKEAGVEGGGVG